MSILNLANINSPTVPLAVTSTSSNVALPMKGPIIVVSNIGLAPAWCATGVTAPVAVVSTGNNMCVPTGETMSFRMGSLDGFLSAVTASGSTTTLSISVSTGQ